MTKRSIGFDKLKHFSTGNCIIYRSRNGEEKCYSYHEVVAEAESLLSNLMSIISPGNRICVQFVHSPQLCTVLLSLLNGGYSFCPISSNASQNELAESLKLYRTPFLISTSPSLGASNKLLAMWPIFAVKCYLFEFSDVERGVDRIRDECYSIRTSGSTGKPKIVRVPYQCIDPNISSLSNVLKVTSMDIVLLSSPITFDPFVVEYLLAMRNGAALLVTSPEILLNAPKLADIVVHKKLCGISIVQLTPSRFRLFGLDLIQKQILNPSTSIRALILGGEQFPLPGEVKNWFLNNNNRTKLYNIYGITEVSCWASMQEVQPGTEENTPIGEPLDLETQIRVVNEAEEPIQKGYGVIQIGSSTRKCMIDGQHENDLNSENVVFRSTGDIGYIIKGKIFYKGRMNEVIKRRGHRVHLGQIERSVCRVKGVQNVCCLFQDESMRLSCFIVKDSSTSCEEVRQDVIGALENYEKPDDIEFIEKLPLTEHGKVSRSALSSLVMRSKDATPVSLFTKLMRNVLGVDLVGDKPLEYSKSKRPRLCYDLTFMDAGGTSFQALSLSTEIENLLQRPEPTLLEMMLDNKTTVSSLFDYIRKLDKMPQPASLHRKPTIVENQILLKVAWRFDTGKCVDSNPTCRENVVCVGSHSRLFVTLECESGREISKCILPDRIECQVSFIDPHSVLIGCYDGCLYRIDYLSGLIEWKFDCGGMIKARPLLNGNQVIVASYCETGNLLCLDLIGRQVMWRKKVGTKGIFASPIALNEKSLLACSLSGEVVCVLFDSGQTLWGKKLESPIFSTPSTLTETILVVADVGGMIHGLDIYSGTEVWNHKTGGNIFSSTVIHSMVYDKFIFFGNHDHNMYCMKYNEDTKQAVTNWKTAVDSPVYSTPVVFRLRSGIPAVISCSTKGSIYILDLFTGSILSTFTLDNEIFSSPYVKENRMYIGCRNDHLVCLELVIRE